MKLLGKKIDQNSILKESFCNKLNDGSKYYKEKCKYIRLFLLEKEMATHSSNLAWKIPWTEEPGGLQATVLQRVGHD